MSGGKEVPSVGSTVGAKYRLTRILGTGSMGSVYEATTAEASARGEPSVAIKLLSLAKGQRDGAERRARFLREAAMCAQVKSPHVVPVLDHGIDDETDTPYLVMPLLTGEDLASTIEKTGPLDPGVAVALFVQACEGLKAAHAAGIVHRDVKPSNLFLSLGADGAVCLKIADFGLAKSEELSALTTSGAFMGTAQYVSPEQATNAKRADVRSDIWSLGMTLYHALAGRPAFAQTGSFLALVLELTGGTVKPLQDLAPWILPVLARTVHGALVRDSELRCPNAFELQLALDMAVGVDVSRRKLSRSDVVAASPELRAQKAERAEIPHSWEELLRQ